ncbi:hypothetical protein Pmani_019090 [Petrolisthes manimaculis]|uniref:Rhodanese domain-containing protein n=1 Tax=Petrolisthes manimaculis TaxID=1843537 RepID=A0AAE1PLJ5_9EUCA|nr:hypothetical protein Pmani_019090 [Petrolisthes manimaculis]
MKSCTSPLCNTNGPTHPCGYCSQQIAQHSSTVHTCINTTNPNTTNDNTTTPHTTTTSTPLHHHTTTTSPLHLHQHQHHHTASVAARRINRRTELDFEELRALQLAGDIALIDVRDTQEIQNYGEIPGSLNIPLCKIKVALQLSEDDWEREFQIEKPDKSDRNLVFYARGPNASSTAVEIAHRLGFNRSRHYIGGWEDYCQQTGVPLKKPQDNGFNGPNFYMNKFDQYFL